MDNYDVGRIDRGVLMKGQRAGKGKECMGTKTEWGGNIPSSEMDMSKY
jgi:hypothetical protein